MNRLVGVVVRRFSRLTKQEVQQSSYEQLVDKMARIYGNQQYRSRSALSLLEIHHLYSVFAEGQRVLDIGTGKGGWASLAIKYNKSTQLDPLLVCVDTQQLPRMKGAKQVRGDFTEEETRVEVVQALGTDKLFNTILVDVEPTYSSITEIDASKINLIVASALDFGQRFMNVGGTMVCKTLLSSETPQLEREFRSYFSQMHKYKPSHSRQGSPMRYYILKGFLMTETAMLINKFTEEFENSNNKLHVIRKFRKNRSELFDPDRIVGMEAERNVFELMKEGQTEQQVLAAFEPYNFVDPKPYIEKYKKMLRLKNGPAQAKMDFMKSEYGQDFRYPVDIPNTNEDKLKLVEQVQREMDQEERGSRREQDPDQQLLKKDEPYLKNTVTSEAPIVDFYEIEDLNEEIFDDSKGMTPNELSQMSKLMPGFDKLAKKLEDGTLTDQDISNFTQHTFEQEQASQMMRKRKEKINLKEMADAHEKEAYQQELQQDYDTFYKDINLSREKKERRRRGSSTSPKKPSRRPKEDDDDFD